MASSTPARRSGSPLASPRSSAPAAPSRSASPPPAPRAVDRFGFYVSPDGSAGSNDDRPGHHAASPPLSQYQLLIEATRTVKWQAMIATWEKTLSGSYAVVKRRVRKGIPDTLRGEAWMLLSGAHARKADAPPGEYARLVSGDVSRADELCIDLDLPRTYPNHYLFATPVDGKSAERPAGVPDAVGPLSPGQLSLRNVLRAFCVAAPDVGYCQGMAFVAGLLLCYAPEEDAFWMLLSLSNDPRFLLRGLYSPGLPRFAELMAVFAALVDAHLPKLATHFKDAGVEHALYASQWFITLFTYSFRFDVVTRVWDSFLLEGWKVVYRVALGVLKVNEKALLGMGFDELMRALKTLSRDAPPDAVMDAALAMPLKRSRVAALTAAWQSAHGAEMAKRVATARDDARKRESALNVTASKGGADEAKRSAALLRAARAKPQSRDNGAMMAPSMSGDAVAAAVAAAAAAEANGDIAAIEAAADRIESGAGVVGVGGGDNAVGGLGGEGVVDGRPRFPFVTTAAQGLTLDGRTVNFDVVEPISTTSECVAASSISRARVRGGGRDRTGTVAALSALSPLALSAAMHTEHRKVELGYGAVLTALETVDVVLECPQAEGGDLLLVRGLQGLSLGTSNTTNTAAAAAHATLLLAREHHLHASSGRVGGDEEGVLGGAASAPQAALAAVRSPSGASTSVAVRDAAAPLNAGEIDVDVAVAGGGGSRWPSVGGRGAAPRARASAPIFATDSRIAARAVRVSMGGAGGGGGSPTGTTITLPRGGRVYPKSGGPRSSTGSATFGASQPVGVASAGVSPSASPTGLHASSLASRTAAATAAGRSAALLARRNARLSGDSAVSPPPAPPPRAAVSGDVISRLSRPTASQLNRLKAVAAGGPSDAASASSSAQVSGASEFVTLRGAAARKSSSASSSTVLIAPISRAPPPPPQTLPSTTALGGVPTDTASPGSSGAKSSAGTPPNQRLRNSASPVVLASPPTISSASPRSTPVRLNLTGRTSPATTAVGRTASASTEAPSSSPSRSPLTSSRAVSPSRVAMQVGFPVPPLGSPSGGGKTAASPLRAQPPPPRTGSPRNPSGLGVPPAVASSYARGASVGGRVSPALGSGATATATSTNNASSSRAPSGGAPSVGSKGGASGSSSRASPNTVGLPTAGAGGAGADDAAVARPVIRGGASTRLASLFNDSSPRAPSAGSVIGDAPAAVPAASFAPIPAPAPAPTFSAAPSEGALKLPVIKAAPATVDIATVADEAAVPPTPPAAVDEPVMTAAAIPPPVVTPAPMTLPPLAPAAKQTTPPAAPTAVDVLAVAPPEKVSKKPAPPQAATADLLLQWSSDEEDGS